MALYKVHIQVRNDFEEDWNTNNPILQVGELGAAYNIGEADELILVGLKLGIGAIWSETTYLPFGSGISVADVMNSFEDSDSIQLVYNSGTGKYSFDFIGEALPDQTGTEGKFLKSIGGLGVWSSVTSTEYYEFKCNSDIKTTSDDQTIKGIVSTATESRRGDDGTSLSSGTFTYSYRLGSSGTWTSNVSFAALRTFLLNPSDADREVVVKATNVTTIGASRVIITIN